ncbi:SOS response-associated peptidase [Nanoarchaeota archaeon]
MCGRFGLYTNIEVIKEEFDIDKVEGEYKPSYNIAPSHNAMVVVSGSTILKAMKWGLVPFWAKDEKMGYKMINARSETLLEKASFKHSFQRRRCIIPADGFFEWKNKKPVFIHAKGLVGFGGIYDRWKRSGKELVTFSIITTEASSGLRKIHDRMPLIIAKKDREKWINSETSIDKIVSMMKPSDKLDYYSVSTVVNSPKNNSKDCIKKVN